MSQEGRNKRNKASQEGWDKEAGGEAQEGGDIRIYVYI